jgi:hypothetical protein
MKNLLSFILLSFIFGITLYSQESEADIHTVTSEFECIEIIRMRTGTDLLEGLNMTVEENDIKNAVILAGIGSVTDYLFHVVSDKNLPPAEEFPKVSVAMDLTFFIIALGVISDSLEIENFDNYSF